MVFVTLYLKRKHVTQAFRQRVHNFHGDSKEEGGTFTPSSKTSARDGYEVFGNCLAWPLKYLTFLPSGWRSTSLSIGECDHFDQEVERYSRGDAVELLRLLPALVERSLSRWFLLEPSDHASRSPRQGEACASQVMSGGGQPSASPGQVSAHTLGMWIPQLRQVRPPTPCSRKGPFPGLSQNP